MLDSQLKLKLQPLKLQLPLKQLLVPLLLLPAPVDRRSQPRKRTSIA